MGLFRECFGNMALRPLFIERFEKQASEKAGGRKGGREERLAGGKVDCIRLVTSCPDKSNTACKWPFQRNKSLQGCKHN